LAERSLSDAPPSAFREYSRRFPRLAQAWDAIRDAEAQGPLDERTRRLIKLAASIASRSEGATHSATRKALAAGASREEIYQVVALAAASVGMPGSVAAFTWVEDVLRVRGGGDSPGSAARTSG
jgi:alkylhydroperoxidase/carboxymuconolactone decarboxylase family protein YurZ